MRKKLKLTMDMESSILLVLDLKFLSVNVTITFAEESSSIDAHGFALLKASQHGSATAVAISLF